MSNAIFRCLRHVRFHSLFSSGCPISTYLCRLVFSPADRLLLTHPFGKLAFLLAVAWFSIFHLLAGFNFHLRSCPILFRSWSSHPAKRSNEKGVRVFCSFFGLSKKNNPIPIQFFHQPFLCCFFVRQHFG